MYPLKFTPIYKERIWGGSNLEKIFGRKIPNCNIGESWDLSNHVHGMSIVQNGELVGWSLYELVEKYKTELMGNAFGNITTFPLLIKLIDANDNLSIQVHPDDEYAAQVEQGSGKTEAWYVVYAKENAQVIYGLQEHITKDDFNQALADNRIDKVVKKVSVKAGDMIFVPAGTVHALLEGVMVYEVQQNSDTTYRIYDYDRLDDQGQKRTLHVEKALDVIQFAYPLNYDFTAQKVQCPYFSMETLRLVGEREEKTEERFIIYCVILGFGQIEYQGRKESLQPGDTILIPACLGSIVVKGELTLLKITQKESTYAL